MNLAEEYADVIADLQTGGDIDRVDDRALDIAIAGTELDIRDRLGRISRYPQAREAGERAVNLAGEERLHRVSAAASREARGEPVDVDDEAVLLVNATLMLQVLQAARARRCGKAI